MTVQPVSEFAATAPEQIEHFAHLMRFSENRQKVFAEIYRGQSKKPKTVLEIADRTGLTTKQVLNAAKPLAVNHAFEQKRHNGRTAYRKYANLYTVFRKILRLAQNSEKLKKHVTVHNPKKTTQHVIRVAVKGGNTGVSIDVKPITIDDIDNFSKVRGYPATKLPKQMNPARLPEKQFKNGIAKILGNRGEFTDWGGEKDDIYSSQLRIDGKRYAASIGLKGPATVGPLTPGKMGKNGDQIQRLFDSTSQAFIVQYEGRIAESVVQQLQKPAIANRFRRTSVCSLGLSD